MVLAVALATTAGEANVSKNSFGTTAAGQLVDRYTLANNRGTIARVITYGGIITELLVRDRAGLLGDVVLGFDRLEQYERENPYFRLYHRAGRQPHRRRQILPRWSRVRASGQQRAQSPARWARGL